MDNEYWVLAIKIYSAIAVAVITIIVITAYLLGRHFA